ncbi:MAG: polymorphic toxin type 50 domain-containing protein [Ruminococcus sp.]|nr:polymorphic toxin type 50 domain-containing protein [Ruminococcus sp.]
MTESSEDGIITDERIAQAVKNGDITFTLSPEKQNPHIYGSKEYDPAQNKSYFTVSLEELQEILDESYGTGKAIVKESWQIRETIWAEEAIGVVVTPTGENLGGTNKFTVHYSKKKTHIVPTKKEKP